MKNENLTPAKITAKKDVTTKKVTAKKPKVVSLNLDKYAAKLQNVEIKEKKSKDSFYKYPDTFTALDINEKKGKQFRAKTRKKMSTFENNIFVFTKTKQVDKLKIEVSLFNDFYKEFYQINDYSLKSITQSVADAKTVSLQTMLDIVKEVNNAK